MSLKTSKKRFTNNKANEINILKYMNVSLVDFLILSASTELRPMVPTSGSFHAKNNMGKN